MKKLLVIGIIASSFVLGGCFKQEVVVPGAQKQVLENVQSWMVQTGSVELTKSIEISSWDTSSKEINITKPFKIFGELTECEKWLHITKSEILRWEHRALSPYTFKDVITNYSTSSLCAKKFMEILNHEWPETERDFRRLYALWRLDAALVKYYASGKNEYPKIIDQEIEKFLDPHTDLQDPLFGNNNAPQTCWVWYEYATYPDLKGYFIFSCMESTIGKFWSINDNWNNPELFEIMSSPMGYTGTLINQTHIWFIKSE